MKTIDDIRTILTSRNDRSAWNKGVTDYALELLEKLEEAINDGYFNPADLANHEKLKAELLNGASDWNQYSWGGSGLIYDTDIAESLCTPSELKRKKGGELRPNSREEWLDVQARALGQAFYRIKSAAKD